MYVYSVCFRNGDCHRVRVLLIAVVTVVVIVSSGNRVRRVRGESITRLLELLPGKTIGRDHILNQLSAELQDSPVRYMPEPSQNGGWFARASEGLTLLRHDPKDAMVVDWYFTCFSFPMGKQMQVLEWLHRRLAEESEQPRMAILRRIAERILSQGGARESEWLYQRVLDVLRNNRDDAELKTLALYAGRTSYARKRGGPVTIYDEQAIANDLAACSRS